MRYHIPGLAQLAMLLSIFVAPAQGQEAAPLLARSLSELSQQVRPGENLVVTGRDGREETGRLETATATHLVLNVHGAVRKFAESDLGLVQRHERDSLVNGALIGAAAGGLPVALLLLAATASGDLDCRLGPGCAAGILLWTGIGTGIGVAVDAAVRRKRTIFLAPSGNAGPRVSLAPIIGRERKGVAMVVRF